MKRTALYSLNVILLILLIMPASCMSSPDFLPVRGSGATIEKSFNVSDFHGIDVSSGFDVILIQGNSENVVITAQENLFEHIKVEVEQGVLKIYTEKNTIAIKPMKARISFKNIDNLKVSGGGDVLCETPVNVPQLTVRISGGGDLEAEISTDELACHFSGGGDADIDGNIKKYSLEMSGGGDVKSFVDAGMIDCRISGGGDLTLKNKGQATEAYVSISGGGDATIDLNVEKIKCTVSGGGDATLTGRATGFEIQINGGGDVMAGDFVTELTRFNVSGGSDVHVNATKELSGVISGGGDVYYSGDPAIATVDAKGGSKIHKE